MREDRCLAASVFGAAAVASLGLLALTQYDAIAAHRYVSKAGPAVKTKFRVQAQNYGYARDASIFLIAGVSLAAAFDAYRGALVTKPRASLPGVHVWLAQAVGLGSNGILITGEFQ